MLTCIQSCRRIRQYRDIVSRPFTTDVLRDHLIVVMHGTESLLGKEACSLFGVSSSPITCYEAADTRLNGFLSIDGSEAGGVDASS